MHQIACTSFKIFPEVTLPDHFWCKDPESGASPQKSWLRACNVTTESLVKVGLYNLSVFSALVPNTEIIDLNNFAF